MQTGNKLLEDFRKKFADFPTKETAMKYTGNKMLGIATLHKSIAQPVFSVQEAKEISAMRR